MDTTSKSWIYPSTPDEIVARPWLSPFATDYLESILCPEWVVLEQGSGGSTLWFAERVHRVVSIEHTDEWRNKVRSLAPGNVTLLTDLPAPSRYAYDLFFIDGERSKRGECILSVEKYVLPGGWVLLDNSNRPEYAKEREHLFDVATLIERFDGNVPGSKYFVTEFWQCHASE